MKKSDSNPDGLYQELANRFGALSKFFGQFNSPKAAQKLLDSLTSKDGAAFKRFVDPVEIPMRNPCSWVLEVVKVAVVTPTGWVEDCYLRENLTPAESQLYFQIFVRYFRRWGGRGSTAPPLMTVQDGRDLVQPGSFRDELKANNLVDCKQRMTYDTGIAGVFSKSETVCF